MSAEPKSILQLRPMHDHDLQRVLVVEGRCYDFPWSHGVFLDCIRAGYCCWVASCDAQFVGHAIMAVAAREAHVLNVCVDPEHRRRGYAKYMLAKLLSLAIDHQAEICFLEVRPSNTSAIALYQHAGFTQVAVRRNYYPTHGGREDALVLSRPLRRTATPTACGAPGAAFDADSAS